MWRKFRAVHGDRSVSNFVNRYQRQHDGVLRGAVARALERFIEERACLKVEATPVLTLTGWYVTRTAKSDVVIVKPWEFRQVALDRNRKRLTESEIARITAVIERECRDVEW